jgi:arginine-tRNA-protein transferase
MSKAATKAAGAGARAGGEPSPSCVQLYGEYANKSCGYCKGGTSVSFGLKSVGEMRNDDYEGLMHRGFRRCGDFYYKPVMHKV